MGYEIYGFLEVQATDGEWKPIITTKRIGNEPEEISYIWSCGRNVFHEELVKASTIVDREHSLELFQTLSAYDPHFDFEKSELEIEEDEIIVRTISLGSLRYIAYCSELVDTPSHLVTSIDAICDYFDIYQEKLDTIRFTFFESY